VDLVPMRWRQIVYPLVERFDTDSIALIRDQSRDVSH